MLFLRFHIYPLLFGLFPVNILNLCILIYSLDDLASNESIPTFFKVIQRNILNHRVMSIVSPCFFFSFGVTVNRNDYVFRRDDKLQKQELIVLILR